MLKFKQENAYQGPIDEAPAWARRSVAPWYRRFLASTLTVYLTIVVGLCIDMLSDKWYYSTLTWPTLVLLLTVVRASRDKWYRDRFQEAEAKNKPKQSSI